jgi:hypothetical protein
MPTKQLRSRFVAPGSVWREVATSSAVLSPWPSASKHAQRSPLTRFRLEAHLTTFVDGYINVDLAADTIQEPMIRFTNDGMAPMIIRFIVGAFHMFELHRSRRFISTQPVSGPICSG